MVWPPTSATAIARGFSPALVIVLATVSLPVSITLTLPEPRLATYSLAPSNVSAQPVGSVPTGMVLVTLCERASITDTVPLTALVT